SNKWARHTFVWVLLVLASIFIWFTFIGNRSAPAQIDASQLAQEIRAGKVTKIVSASQSDDIEISYSDTKEVKTARLPPNTNILKAYDINLANYPNVKLETRAASQWGGVLSTLTFILPTLFLVGIFVFMMRQAQGSNNQAISFGKSRARMFTGNRPTVTFADVDGVEEGKQKLQEIVEFLKLP